MCDPVTAVAVGSAVAGLVGSYMQVGAAEDAQNAQAAAFITQRDQNQANAIASQQTQTQALNDQEIQANRQDAQELLDSQIGSRKAQATARAAAATGGVSGLSVDALIGEFRRTEGRFKSVTNMNAEARQVQGARTREAIGLQTQGRIQAVQPPAFQDIPAPDYVGAALRIGGSLGGAYFDDPTTFDGITNIFDTGPVVTGGGRA